MVDLLLAAAILAVILYIFYLIFRRDSVNVKFLVKLEDGTMAVVEEFELGDGGEATIRLLPVNMLDTPAEIENVNFTSSDEDVTLTVDINDPLLFIANSLADLGEEKDVVLNLSADGRIGEGTNPIEKTLVVHLRRRAAVDVKFDVNVVR